MDYTYDYSFNTRMEDTTGKFVQPVGYQVTSTLKLRTLWMSADKKFNFFRANLRAIHVKSSEARDSNSDAFSGNDQHFNNLLSPAFYFKLSNGKSDGIWLKKDSHTTYKNVAKAIVNLFTLKEGEDNVDESSVFGVCKTKYTLSPSSETENESKVVKEIFLDQCQAASYGFNGHWSDLTRPLSPHQKSFSLTTYTIKDWIIASASSQDDHTVKLPGRKIDVLARSKLSLELKDASTASEKSEYKSEEEAIESITSDLTKEGIEYTVEDSSCSNSCSNLSKVIASNMESLTSKQSTAQVTRDFMHLVEAFRRASYEDILQILRDDKLDNIKYPLIDIATAAQTDAAQGALMDYIEFEYPPDILLVERYLVALSVAIHPTRKMLADALSVAEMVLPDKNIHESAVLSLAALVNTYRKRNPDFYQEQLFTKIQDFLFDKVTSSLEDEDAAQVYLIALSNAALPQSQEMAIMLATNASSFKIMVSAINVLTRMPAELITGNTRNALLKIYFQRNRKYDDTVRIAAATIILSKSPTKKEIHRFAFSLAKEKKQEVRKFMASTLTLMATRNKEFRLSYSVESILSNVARHHLTKGKFKALAKVQGFSRAIKTQIADIEGDITSDFSLNLEYTKSGITRRSTFDLMINAGDRSVKVLTIGLYAEGLLSLLGGEEDDTAESPRAHASLGLMDTSLRPYQLFHGQSELFAAAMSTGGGETDILSTHLLLMDHNQQVIFGSGLSLSMQVDGALTLALGGSVDMSLWSRTSNTVVINRAAVVLHGIVESNFDNLKIGLDLTASGVTRVDFTTIVDFSGIPMKMCLKMSRDDLQAKILTQAYEKANRSNKGYVKNYSTKQLLPGESYLMDEEVSKICQEMTDDE